MTETKTPSPTPGVTSSSATAQSGVSPRSDFMAAALGMSWQLAIVVLVPIVGGFELDNLFATSPLLVIVGFIVALVGFTLVVRRQMQIFTPPATAVNTIKPNSPNSKGPAE